MHTIEIPERDLKLQMPPCWEECSNEQAQHILELAFEVINGKLSLGDFRIRTFIYLTNLKLGFKYLIRQKLGLNDLINERIYMLSEQLCSWVFNQNSDGKYELNLQTVNNIFPVLEDTYYGPEALLADITFGEFKSSLGVLNKYFEHKDSPEEAQPFLDFFIASIYRPKDSYGNRVPFHKYVVKPEIFEKTPLWIKQAIVIWYSYCIKCIQNEDLVINDIEVNFSALFPKGDEPGKRNNGLGWTGVMMEIAETGVFGDTVSTAQTPLYDILIFLLKKYEESKKIKK